MTGPPKTVWAPMQTCWSDVVIGGREPACRAHRNLEGGAGSILFPAGCAGATWRRRRLCVMALTAEPPAHYRLVSDHDLSESWRSSIVTARAACHPCLK